MTDDQPPGVLVRPRASDGRGVLVLHAWWGLNDTIRGVCLRLAEAGYVAFAPDLYRGRTADTIAGAEALGAALDARHMEAKAELVQAARYLRACAGVADRGLAVIGFSLGAYYALHLANAQPELIRAVVLFYGTGGDDFAQSRAAYLGHYAENDPYEPSGNVDRLADALRSAGRPATIHRYPDTGHWFFEPDRVDAYHPAAAALAWERTLAFLRDGG